MIEEEIEFERNMDPLYLHLKSLIEESCKKDEARLIMLYVNCVYRYQLGVVHDTTGFIEGVV